MNLAPEIVERVKSCVNRQRLVETARQLIDVPSPTGAAAAVSDRLAEILAADGFTVKRPTGGYPESPAVVIRLDSGRPGEPSSSMVTLTQSICHSSLPKSRTAASPAAARPT